MAIPISAIEIIIKSSGNDFNGLSFLKAIIITRTRKATARIFTMEQYLITSGVREIMTSETANGNKNKFRLHKKLLFDTSLLHQNSVGESGCMFLNGKFHQMFFLSVAKE